MLNIVENPRARQCIPPKKYCYGKETDDDDCAIFNNDIDVKKDADGRSDPRLIKYKT